MGIENIKNKMKKAHRDRKDKKITETEMLNNLDRFNTELKPFVRERDDQKENQRKTAFALGRVDKTERRRLRRAAN